MGMIDNLEAMLAAGRDNALLRFSLGSEYLREGDAAQAVRHLRAAVEQDPDYSAAWKVLGKALLAQEDPVAAAAAWRCGIGAAVRKGDKQAEKEMNVFLKRAERQLAGN